MAGNVDRLVHTSEKRLPAAWRVLTQWATWPGVAAPRSTSSTSLPSGSRPPKDWSMRTRPVWRGLKRSQSARRHLMSADPVTYPATLRVPAGIMAGGMGCCRSYWCSWPSRFYLLILRAHEVDELETETVVLPRPRVVAAGQCWRGVPVLFPGGRAGGPFTLLALTARQ